jgi:hypothetical protein
LKEIAMAVTLEPDLSERRPRLSVEGDEAASSAALFRARTQQFDLWFAAPGSVIMDAGINKVFYFVYKGKFQTRLVKVFMRRGSFLSEGRRTFQALQCLGTVSTACAPLAPGQTQAPRYLSTGSAKPSIARLSLLRR